LGFLGACGGGSTEVTPPQVTVAFLRHDSPPYARADDAFFAEYMRAHPGVAVEATTVRYPTLGQTLLQDLKNNNLTRYDLVRVQPSWVCSFADNVVDVPEDVLSLSEAQSIFFAAPLSGSVCDGKLKGIPIEYNLEYGGVVVNMTKYRAKYGPTATPSWPDWASFIRQASELTEYDASGVPRANGLDIPPDWPQPVKHLFFSQILQRGGRYRAADGTFTFDTPEGRAALTEMVNWVTRDKVMYPELVPGTNTFITTRLASGSVGYGWGDVQEPLAIMGYVGTWGIPSVLDQLPAANQGRFQYEFHTLPPMVGSAHTFVQNSGWAFVVPRTSQNQQAAWDLVKAFALSTDEMRSWTSITGALPALRATARAAAAAGDPNMTKEMPLLEDGRWVGFIPAEAIETVEGAIVSNYFAAVRGADNGGKTVEQALQDMQRAANDAVAPYR
jgi:multiple sugar transport system substrate-binding protein